MTSVAKLDATTLSKTIDPVMQSFVDRSKVPGLVYLLQHGNEEPIVGCFGSTHLGAGAPLQPDSIFRIASMTKPITAAATLMLVDEGLLALDDPVSRFIPGFDAFRVLVDPEDPTGPTEPLDRPITVRHLLTTASGLSYGEFRHTPIDRLYAEADLFSVQLPELITRLVRLPLEFQPGTGWRYSIAFDVLGYLIQVVAGKPFDTFLQERILDPLGMADTGFVLPAASVGRFTAAYTIPEDGVPLLVDEPTTSDLLHPDRPLHGGGGLISTARDFLRFMRMLRNGGELGGVRVLQPRTVALMVENHLPSDRTPIQVAGTTLEGMGYGLGVGVCVGQTPWLSGMGTGSFWWMGVAGTGVWYDPRRDLIGLLMTQVTMYYEPWITLMNLVNRAVPLD